MPEDAPSKPRHAICTSQDIDSKKLWCVQFFVAQPKIRNLISALQGDPDIFLAGYVPHDWLFPRWVRARAVAMFWFFCPVHCISSKKSEELTTYIKI